VAIGVSFALHDQFLLAGGQVASIATGFNQQRPSDPSLK